MKRFVLAMSVAAATATCAFAHDYTVGALKIGHPWVRATPKGASVGGGYLKITNTGTEPDRLIAGSSDASSKFELHEMSMDGGVMKMRPLTNGISLKPGESVELKPGGLHLMFVDLKKPFVEGQHIKGTLTFEKAGKVDVEYVVEKIAAQGSSEGDHSGAMSHDHAPMGTDKMPMDHK